MADVRALLKAKRQEARVNHPFASYSTNGQLRCLACGTIVKHASSWEGHIGSKAHRTNVARLREEEQRRAVRTEEVVQGKRKADESSPEPEQHAADSKKRRLDRTSVNQPSANAPNGFPADFFSDPSHAPPPPDSDEDGDEPSDATVEAPPPVVPDAARSAIDLEWEKFQQTVLNPPDESETYERATVFAEPILSSTIPEGFPSLQAGEPVAKPEELTEEQKRRQKEQEERELIMDRLLEEERAQEEADAKVVMLKNKLEALRKQRDAKRAARKAQ